MNSSGKFLIDMPLSPELVAWLRQRGHDAWHAADLGLARASDPDILQRAREERCVVITADLDFPRLLALTQASGPGLILLRGGNYSEQEARALIDRVLRAIPVSDLTRLLVVADQTRVRKVSLPV